MAEPENPDEEEFEETQKYDGRTLLNRSPEKTLTRSKIKAGQAIELYEGKRIITNDSKIYFYELYNSQKDLFIAKATRN